MKKLLSLLLVFVMLMTLVPAGAFAAALSPDETHIVAGDPALYGESYSTSPVDIGDTYADEYADLTALAATYPAALEVSKNVVDDITIKLLSDVTGRIELAIPNSNFILDANGKTFSGGEQNEAVSIVNRKNCTLFVVGNGTFTSGRNNTFFVGEEGVLFVQSATISGKINNRYGLVAQAIRAEGKPCFSMKINDGDPVIYTSAQNLACGETDTIVITPLDAIPHSHPVCGDSECEDSHGDIEWTEWTSGNSLPNEAGNYYLTGDVVCTGSWTVPANTNLCLNGYGVYNLTGDILCSLGGNTTFSVCDCSGTGKLSAPKGMVVLFEGNGNTFNMYGGTLSSKEQNTISDQLVTYSNNVVNIYGGNITGKEGPAIGASSTTVNLYGGNISTSESNGVVLFAGASLNLCGNPVIAGANLDVNTLSNSIKTYAAGVIDATDYTGEQLTVYYANDEAEVGDVVVKNVNDETAAKFILSEANDGYMLKREGNNLVYAGTSSAPTYTVSFDANGGTGTMTAVSGVKGAYTLPACTFTAPDGKQFKAWSVDGNEKNVGDTITVSANTTVSAVWENIPAPTYTVTFNANGHGTAPGAISGVEEGSKISAPTAPVADGYTFGGWYKETECQNEWNFDSDTVTGNITLYAKWTEVNQPVIYENYHIISDDLTHVQTVLDGVADVTKDSETGVVTIIFTENIFGRIWIGEDNFNDMSGKFVIDLGGKTIDPGDKEEAICFDNNFEGEAIITGEGVLKTGRNHIIYCNGWEEVWFDVAEGKDYFTLKLDGEDLYSETEKHTEAKSYASYDSYGGDVLTLTQGNFEIYTVTFDANGGSVTPANATTGADGKLATLPTPTRSGSYTFKGWYTSASGGTQVTVDKVYTENTTIYAQWNYTGSTGGGGGVSRYTVKFETNGGTTVANKTVTRNSKLAEPTAPTKDGYTFDGWYTDKELTTAYDFDTKVTKSFTLYAKWVEEKATHVCPSQKFSDLDTTKWYHEDIDYVLDNEIMLGTSDTVFAPEGSLTRGMLVTILYRSEGEPATNKSIPFADVDMSAYYANAVVWAQQNGIVKGISETEYAPEMSVTREQLATVMFRYAQFKGMDAVTAEENLGFNDASDISDWAVAAMNWGVGRDYIFGRTEGVIAPKVAATRAEIAAFIHRYIVNNEK